MGIKSKWVAFTFDDTNVRMLEPQEGIMGIEDKIPLASELRDKLNNAESVAAESQVMELVTKITQALDNGRASVQVMDFKPGVEALMKKRGYKVEHHSADQRDCDSYSYYTISW